MLKAGPEGGKRHTLYQGHASRLAMLATQHEGIKRSETS